MISRITSDFQVWTKGSQCHILWQVQFDWNPAKNTWLKEYRKISFEEIVYLIDEGHLRAVLSHPQKPAQKIFVVLRDGYAYNVPFIEESDGTCFLKAIYPSRASTKKYVGGVK